MNHRQAETTHSSPASFSAGAREIFFHTLFETQANHTPDAVALVFENEQLTYCELDRRANKLARYIQGLGVRPETPVGICLQRSAEMIVGVLAVLKAGGAYLPLDPAYPKERLAFVLRDSQAPILLTRKQWAKILPPCDAQIVCLDTHWAEIARQEAESPASDVTPDNLAYIIYTSGSTGKPKGVLVPHRGLPNVSEEYARTFELDANDRILQFASLSFDASLAEILMALRAGATLCLGRAAHLLPGPDLIETLQAFNVTVATLTPSALATLPAAKLPALRTLCVAGEACPADLVARWAGGRRFFNLYGPTEATIWTTVAACHDGDSKPPIGHPIANVQAYVLDSQLQPSPPGAAGELHVGGVGLARGYLNRPELSAAKFIPDPFGGEPGTRLYKTGDLVRHLPAGELEFLDRIDHQVKVRGFRIELLEIEVVLRQHPALREVAVLAREDTPGDKHLVAYVVPAGRGQRTKLAGELRSYLQENLPAYMVPSAFVTLEALPLTTSGKVDRQALPAPARTRPELEETFVAPRTPVEEQLAQIWTQVLGYERIGIHDNFFNLGGHSLALTQVLSRVLERFRVELPMASLFETPTVAKLAEQVERARQRGSGQELPPITSVPRDGPLPLTFAQEQVWFLQELVPDNVAYNAQVSVRFKGELDVAAFERTLSEIVRRHEILRTTFSAAGGQPVQIFHPPWTVELPRVDLRAIPGKRREVELERLVKAASRRPFDTTQLPLVRWTLFRLGAQDHVLAHIEHHFVHDGWSFAVLLRELKALYQAFIAGQPSPLTELPFQFADFAVWQRRWMRGEVLQNQLAYWKEQLASSPPMLELPTDRPRPKLQGFRGTAHKIALSPQLYQALKTLSSREDVTLFMTLLAALKVLLYRYTGQEDILIGSGLANRRLRETEGLIGMIVNAVVLRTDLCGDPTFRELLGRVRETALGAYEHQELPFEKLVEALQPERDLSRNPLFQVMFSFHDSAVPELEFAGLTGNIQYRQNDSAKCDLNVLVIPRTEQLLGQGSVAAEEQLAIIWEYDTDLFDAATIERMAKHFQVLLAGIISDAGQRLSDLPILTETERQRLLVEWNQTASGYPCDLPVHELFVAQAAQSPDALAVVWGDQHLTYRKLDRRSNRLAHHLQTLGVGPEVPVCICVERLPEILVGLLSILKAGGAFVPLDPAYPQERLAFMLNDTRSPVLLTQKRLAERFLKDAVHLICLDAVGPVILGASESHPTSEVTTDNLAYIIYTSGSTGTPKGVQIEHRSLLNLVFWHQHTFAVSRTDRATQVAGLSFDASVWEMWPYLTAGASLHLPDQETRTAPQRLRDWLAEERISISFLPTPLAEAILALDWPSKPVLRTLLTGGEKLHHYPAPSLPFALVNNYGPTENTVVTTSGLVPPTGQREHAVAAPSIGRPIANTQVYLLDPDLQPVPVGVPGELYIGGDGQARGYLERPDLTAEAFIPAPPFLLSSGGKRGAGTRLYRTGDLARYSPNRDIEFLGRSDEQVKIRGFRIELGEIETILRQHPTVQEALVITASRAAKVDDMSGEKHLVAYIVPQDGQSPANNDLRAFLKQKLPDYMLPPTFVTLEALPLTPNGKVDRRALPIPDQSNLETGKVFVAPRSMAEEVVADVWAEVMGLERVGVHDDFFALGGHSLLATRIVSRLRDDLQVEIRLRDLFERPTIAQLALVVEEALLEEWETLTDQEVQQCLTTGE